MQQLLGAPPMTVVLAKWSLHDYHAMIDSGLRQEHHMGLVAGNIVEMPSEGLLHE
ncbi:MAG: peptidylprolyl isomerase [Cyanobacteria bacterium P01_F01_bin.33]